MRVDPQALELAQARLRAAACGTLVPGRAPGHRIAARQAALTSVGQQMLDMLTPEKLMIASDAARIDHLVSLAAAIERANDIAVLIDQPSRTQLDEAMGSALRRAAIGARKLAAPPQNLTAAAIITAFEEGRTMARAVWTVAFPPSLVLADGYPPDPRPMIFKERYQCLTQILAHAETLVFPPAGSDATPSEEIAA